jgi:hypothetical protein
MRPTRKARQSKRTKGLSPLSRVLASSENRSTVLSQFFDKLSSGVIRHSVPELAWHRHFQNAIQLNSDNLKDFYRAHTPASNFEKNIAWCLGVMEFHKSKIQLVLDHEDEILTSILYDKLPEGIRSLDTLEASCGVSMWSIGLRGAFLSALDKLDEKRDFITSLYERAGSNAFFKGVVYQKTANVDEGDSSSAERKYFEQKIRRSFSGETLHFLMYKLVQNKFDFDYDFSLVVEIEKNSSPVDIYYFLFDLICLYKFSGNADIYDGIARNVASVLSKKFYSYSLNSIAGAFGHSSEFEFSALEMRVLDSYTKGDYDAVCLQFEQDPLLAKKFAMFEVWAKAAARKETIDSKGYLGELLAATVAVLRRQKGYDSALSFCLRQCEAFSGLTWFKEFHVFLARNTKFVSKHVNNVLDWLARALSTLNSPARASIYAADLQENYMSALKSAAPESLVVHFFSALQSGEAVAGKFIDEVSNLRLKKYQADYLIKNNELSAAVTVLSELCVCSDMLVAYEAGQKLVQAYIALGRVQDAAELYVDLVIANPSLVETFDSDSICNECKNLIGSSASIAIPIAFSLHSRFVNDKYDAALRFGFEKFLEVNETEYPLDVIHLDLPNAALMYFLENVCVPSTMKLYLHLDGIVEIEECRIAICQCLIEKGCSVDAMVFELKERTRQLVIRAGMQHIENSRIYADTGVFVGPASTNFRQLFDKFSSLRAGNFGNEADEKALNEFLTKFAGVQEIEDHAYIVHLQDLVLNEKNSTFLKLIKIMRDEFAFGERGLNGFLSTRIRHGHLPNTLRKSLADESLLNTKVAKSGAYKRNEIWLNKLAHLNHSQLADIDKALVDFSSKFNYLIDEVNDDWLQIFTLDQEISGLTSGQHRQSMLFNYSVTSLESFYLQQVLAINAEYAEFAKVLIRWLWDRTERNLSTIREKIAEEVRARILTFLDNLMASVVSIVGDLERISEFNDAVVRARVSLNSAIDIVLSWFWRSQGLSPKSFELFTAVEIARLSAGAQLLLGDNAGFTYRGDCLSYFVDIFYVLFENAVSKSNLSKDNLSIIVSINIIEGNWVLSITNNCLEIYDVQKANSDLDFYRSNYGREDYSLRAAQGEGNTGLFKVWKALAKDLQLQHQIDFGYVSSEGFSVKISVELETLQKIIYE